MHRDCESQAVRKSIFKAVVALLDWALVIDKKITLAQGREQFTGWIAKNAFEKEGEVPGNASCTLPLPISAILVCG